MNTSTFPAQRVVILAATDGSEASKEAMSAASRFGSMPGSELHLVHVLDPREAAQRESAKADAQALLGQAAAAAGIAGGATLHVAVGVAWREIIQLAADLHADLVVVGTHDRGALERMVLGSVAEQVVKKASCPVYVARRKDYSGAPEIEPPCVACVAVQAETKGATLWCERHSHAHPRGRLHYEYPKGFGGGSQQFQRS